MPNLYTVQLEGMKKRRPAPGKKAELVRDTATGCFAVYGHGLDAVNKLAKREGFVSVLASNVQKLGACEVLR